MKRIIKKAAVLGSGVMGSQIALHFANTGTSVLLLDIAPSELTPDEKKKGFTLNDKVVRNRIVNSAFEAALKLNPSPVYSKSYASRIKTGNFEDDFQAVSDCDWIIEVVIENLEIKKKIFEKVEQYRKPGTLITTNTSGIPINMLIEGRSDDFTSNFCGTHFFNPPRYLKLFEIIPSKQTDPDVISFLMNYAVINLGKTPILCKDTPAFIANRVGVASIMALFHMVGKTGLTVEEVDRLTGSVLGRPKSATFRTCDVVGLDTLVHVANGLKKNLPDDELNELFNLPGYITKMVENKWLGAKTGQGFFKKVKKEGGESEILSLDLSTIEYKSQKKVKFPTLEAARNVDDLKKRLKILVKGNDKAGEFYRTAFYGLFQYVSNRIPEISDDLYKIDMAMNAGFGWELGPFECWDALGVKDTVDEMIKNGFKPAQWVMDMLSDGDTSFYDIDSRTKLYYNIPQRDYFAIDEIKNFILLDTLRPTDTVWKNTGAHLIDIGDGILNLEFHTKMNTIGGEIMEAVNKSLDIAEKDFRGLVISNEGENFSAGANVAMILMFALEQEWDELNIAVKLFQGTNMRLKYSPVPVVVSPHNLCLGGGCEISLHADVVNAHAECYMGLVEFGVGVIPAGGGTKEMAIRMSDSLHEGDVMMNVFRDKFLTIGQAKVSLSAKEAFELGYLIPGKDTITLNRNRLLGESKAIAIRLADAGYKAPMQRKDILVPGKSALGLVYVGADSMVAGNYITPYEKFISEKLGWVLCGGDLSSPARVSEQYLLDLEKEAFLSLCGQKKTLERMQSLLKTGKILRN
ncbi:MAG: 3-hydroxyacyl-CoA dehydrogenase/enoyl-CoA hydratase family protein [Bacteroidetes bacterium]|nr:3-hydroxyacyl-CoA dehydrogenase/enoyl-CoA hydratase family protein [Bacteroidota bacterium]